MSDGGFVYVIRFGDYDHKIGVSYEPERRRAQVGGERVCRTWRGLGFNAYHIEGAAHRLLRSWRVLGVPGVERFQASEATACKAVELAIALLNDKVAHGMATLRDAEERASVPAPPARTPRPAPEPEREMFGPPAELAPPMFGPPAPFRIGYAQRAGANVLDLDVARLVAAGVQRARIYTDCGLEPGPGFAAALKACRSGDFLVVAQDKHAGPETIETLARKGAYLVRAAA